MSVKMDQVEESRIYSRSLSQGRRKRQCKEKGFGGWKQKGDFVQVPTDVGYHT